MTEEYLTQIHQIIKDAGNEIYELWLKGTGAAPNGDPRKATVGMIGDAERNGTPLDRKIYHMTLWLEELENEVLDALE